MAKSKAPRMDVLEYYQDSCYSRTVTFEDVLKLSHVTGKITDDLHVPYVPTTFASFRDFVDREDLRSSLSDSYAIPRVFWTPLCRNSNGYFGCENLYDGDGNLEGHNTWYRIIIKIVAPMQSSYSWAEMSFYTKWTPHFTLNFCFDVPRESQMRLRQGLDSREQSFGVGDLYASHVIILDQILMMFDESVWALRDGVRQIEMGRNESSRPKADYPFLHDLARHVIHSTETLGVALDTVDRMIEQQGILTAAPNPNLYSKTKHLRQTEHHLQFQRQMLKNLRARSEANQLRLQNEINFAFNIAAQSQSELLVSINKETKDDGTAMRAVALVTLIFLPATFVSALFSTTFFNFTPGNESQQEAWVISKDFWIYWSVTIPLTVVTMAIWFMWRHWQRGILR